jgi:hypothetical protein
MAKTCPHCGQDSPYKKPASSGVGLKFWGIFALALLIPMLMAQMNAPTNTPVNTGISDEDAHKLCIQAIQASVNNPSTLDIQRVVGYGQEVLDNGTHKIIQSFSAKNGFGLEKKYDALCLVSPKGKLKDFKVREQTGQ